eukprot:TRINITY_DN19025_c0_g1_i1.p1 TRINITY_DN19025_c0_g1~~TRINITY_DN19025_c0_g1_i1.p1  ORF type:complete len:609 (+),score=59.90 TRINITY_DN19025_c0_g1_i1:198-2024(+)
MMDDAYAGLVISRSMQVLLGLIQIVYLWHIRADAVALYKRACQALQFSSRLTEKQKKFMQRVSIDFQKWRSEVHRAIMKALLPALSVFSIRIMLDLRDTLDVHYLLTRMLIFVAVCMSLVLAYVRTRSSSSTSSLFFDVFLFGFVLIYCGKLYSEFHGFEHSIENIADRCAPVLKLVISVVYLNFRRVAVVNAMLTVLAIGVHAAGTDWQSDVLVEILNFMFTLILAYAVEEGARSLVTERLEGKTTARGWGAACAILRVLCDAVVHVGCDLTILNDCPQLGYMLMSGIGASHKLQGGHFLRYVVNEDKQKFTDFITQQTELSRADADADSDNVTDAFDAAIPPAAINVRLKDTMGTIFRVEVIRSHLPNFDEDGHLLGIRDLGDHSREERLDVDPPENIRIGEPVPRLLGSSAMSSKSSDSDSCENSESFKVRSLSMLLDVANDEMRILEATLTFLSFNEDVATADEERLPNLATWMSSKKSRPFHAWAQNATNCLAYGEAFASFGKVTLRPFGSLVEMKAKSVHAHTDEHTDLVRFNFDDVDVILPEMTRKGTPSLPCIREKSRATRTSPIAAPVSSEITHSTPPKSSLEKIGNLLPSSWPHCSRL